MLVTLRQLRHNGRKLPESAWKNQPARVGWLHLCSVQGLRQLNFALDGSQRTEDIITLYAPELLSMQHNGMRFRGFQKVGSGEDAAGVMQEWLCELYQRPIPDWPHK